MRLLFIMLAVPLAAALGSAPASAATGDIIFGPFTPTPAGNGRAVAFDGNTTLYYTLKFDTNIYKVRTTDGASLGAIPNPGRTFVCGALSFDGTDLWCGTHNGADDIIGTGDVQKVNPDNGVATFAFNAFSRFGGGSCVGRIGFIDGLAFDPGDDPGPGDDTIWLSGDADVEIHHFKVDGTFIATFDTPNRPSSTVPGCNSGIEVLPGGALALNLFGPLAVASSDGGSDTNNYIVVVPKADPSAAHLFSFITQAQFCCEGLSFDAETFAPLVALWANTAAAVTNEIKAFDITTPTFIVASVAVSDTIEPRGFDIVQGHGIEPPTSHLVPQHVQGLTIRECEPDLGISDPCNDHAGENADLNAPPSFTSNTNTGDTSCVMICDFVFGGTPTCFNVCSDKF